MGERKKRGGWWDYTPGFFFLEELGLFVEERSLMVVFCLLEVITVYLLQMHTCLDDALLFSSLLDVLPYLFLFLVINFVDDHPFLWLGSGRIAAPISGKRESRSESDETPQRAPFTFSFSTSSIRIHQYEQEDSSSSSSVRNVHQNT